MHEEWFTYFFHYQDYHILRHSI